MKITVHMVLNVQGDIDYTDWLHEIIKTAVSQPFQDGIVDMALDNQANVSVLDVETKLED